MSRNSIAIRKARIIKKAAPLFKRIEQGDKTIGFSEIGRNLGVSRQTISQWFREWQLTVEGQPEELGITTLKVEMDAYSRIQDALPSTLDKVITRIAELIPKEENLTKVTMAFRELAPYYLHRIDDDNDTGDKTKNVFYQNLINQYNITDGQSKEPSNNGDKT